MRNLWLITVLTVLVTGVVMLGCDDGQYSNPTSPYLTTSEWRSISIDEYGGTISLPEIGIYLSIPQDAVPEGEVYTFNVRLNPPNVPLGPSGLVTVRLGTFEMSGPDVSFLRAIDVRFRIADEQSPGVFSRGYRLNSDNFWEYYGNANIFDDGRYATISVMVPGIFGAFEAVPLHVEASVSQQMGPVPLSVGFKAIVTGGHPPYSALWDFGDNEDPKGGLSVAHAYGDPGDYTVTVTVMDAEGHVATDWVHLTAYYIASPPALP
jgi:hypothetical protein